MPLSWNFYRLPRISAPGISRRKPLPPQSSPDDELDARRLGLRLAALAAALDDLPKQALRFALWQARQKRTRDSLAEAARHDRACHGAKAGQAAGPDRTKAFCRPLRRGHPPGSHGCARHELHDILVHAHALARFALDRRDTS